jgi:DNA-directed RNA polymerase specialized sigma subunit
LNISPERPADDAASLDFEALPSIDNPPAKPREERPTTPANLTRWRCRLPVLAPDEERRLIIRYKAGDGAAGNELASRFHRLVLAEVVRYRGLFREGLQECDLIAAGMAGFAKALADYDLRRNTRLGSLALSLIKWRIKDCALDWRRRGQAGATKADKWLRSHREATAEQIVAAVGCRLRDAEAAIARLKMYWHGDGQYLDDPAVEDDDAAPATLSVRTRTRGPDLIDRAAEEADRRAKRRIQEVGRRQYALELVEHDRKRIAARSEPSRYLYPPVVLHLALLQSNCG